MSTIEKNMSVVKSDKRSKMIEEVIPTKEKSKLGNNNNKKNNKNDLNTQMTKTPDFKRSISLQTSKKKDQKGLHSERQIALFTYSACYPFRLL